jgi:hypothetical protein
VILRFILLFFLSLLAFVFLAQHSPQWANNFFLIVFGLAALYLLIRLPLEFWLHHRKQDEDEKNHRLIGEGSSGPFSKYVTGNRKPKIFYNIEDYYRARKQRWANRK